jgi:hypothetical protein
MPPQIRAAMPGARGRYQRNPVHDDLLAMH